MIQKLNSILLALLLLTVESGWSASEQELQVTVANIAVTRYEVDTMAVTGGRAHQETLPGLKFKFDLEIRNNSDKPINLPLSYMGETDPAFVFQGIEIQKPDGSWRSFFGGDFMSPQTHYAACHALPPGQSLAFRSVTASQPFLTKQIADVGDKPKLRFSLWFPCQDSDGKVSIKSTITEPFIAPID